MTEQLTTPPQSHGLRLESVELVGAFRKVDLYAGMNIVRGDITTGKTTFVRLIRALLGAIPKHLPPETDAIRSIAADLVLGDRTWQILRPMVTTKDAPVEVAEKLTPGGELLFKGDTDTVREGIALRLPAAGTGGFGEFLLQQLGVPVVFVPRRAPTPRRTSRP